MTPNKGQNLKRRYAYKVIMILRNNVEYVLRGNDQHAEVVAQFDNVLNTIEDMTVRDGGSVRPK